jgi:hypothetical protein
MGTETIESRYHFSVAQLEAMSDADIGRIHDEGQDQRDLSRWHEAIAWSTDPRYREMRVAQERGRVWPPPRPRPEPAPAPQPQVVVRGWNREEIHAFIDPLKRYINRKIGEAVGGLANAERVTALMARIDELERRATAAERRLANAESRFDSQARHLRNLQSRLDGTPVEHSPKVPR